VEVKRQAGEQHDRARQQSLQELETAIRVEGLGIQREDQFRGRTAPE